MVDDGHHTSQIINGGRQGDVTDVVEEGSLTGQHRVYRDSPVGLHELHYRPAPVVGDKENNVRAVREGRDAACPNERRIARITAIEHKIGPASLSFSLLPEFYLIVLDNDKSTFLQKKSPRHTCYYTI